MLLHFLVLLHSRSFEIHRSMNNILRTHIISNVMLLGPNHASSLYTSIRIFLFWRHLHDKQNLRIVFNELGFHDRSIIYDLWLISCLFCEWVTTKEGTLFNWQNVTYLKFFFIWLYFCWKGSFNNRIELSIFYPT